ncbi:DUF4007 family protein [Balneola vulgaris]|uniref:DUF4007 family protein n=1 Tax=Balneola vulgaris TaxID=287535 RepID=UPI000362BC1F|nr:DUF4007 family protein [Balneola vulgaris]
MGTLSFSGHESFQCRNLWLKKGYEFTIADKNFNDNLSVIELGVGKNMVSSIKYWMKAFDLLDDNGSIKQLTSIIFDDTGKDPYLEDIGTLWLLHYNLVSANKASIYNLFFNYFRKQRIEFSKLHLINYLITECNHREEKHSENTIETDVGVLLKNYVRPNSKFNSKDIEDSFSSLLIELDLIKPIIDRKDWYECKNESRPSLPTEIVLYSILSNPKYKSSSSISFNHLLNDENSPGLVFALDADSLLMHVKAITEKFEGVVYKEDAGIRELQFSSKPELSDVIEAYYD